MFSHRDRYLKALKKAFSLIRGSLGSLFWLNHWIGFGPIQSVGAGIIAAECPWKELKR
jgi:hypothetical protein